jgi:DNA-binding NtrC family response regulator
VRQTVFEKVKRQTIKNDLSPQPSINKDMITSTIARIFIVDDNQLTLAVYQKYLYNLGYTNVLVFENGTDCLNSITQQPDVIFLDYNIESANGLDVLKGIKESNPNIYVVFISGQKDVQTAITSLHFGAYDYIVKGENDTNRIKEVLDKINERRHLQIMNSKSSVF